MVLQQLKRQVKRLLKGAAPASPAPMAPVKPSTTLAPPHHKRFLSNQPRRTEPCEDMIRLANERVHSFFEHHRIKDRPQVAFHCCTLEECALPDSSFDAVFFHAALHHVIDEEQGLAQCFRVLKPGGVLGVSE